MKKLIIFDFDGTLLDTLSPEIVRYNYILKRAGYPELTADSLKYMSRCIPEKFLSKLISDPQKLKEAIGLRWKIDLDLNDLNLFDGVLETLNALKESSKYELAIATGRGKSIYRFLKHFALDKYFSCVVTLRDYKSLKPEPDCINLSVERMGYADKKDKVFYVGDMQTDLDASNKAGVCFVGYGDKFEGRSDVTAFTDFRSIKKHFLEN